jgi:hypothetical protein
MLARFGAEGSMSGFSGNTYVSFTNSDPNTTANPDTIYKDPGTTGAYFNVYDPTNEVFQYISISGADTTSVFTVSVTNGSLLLNGVSYTSYSNTVGNAATTLNQLVFVPDTTNPGRATVTLSVADSGTVVGTSESFYVQCFTAGTLIATPDGARVVESLRPGDLVLNAAGTPRAVKFLGHRTLDLTKSPEHAPVRFPAGSIADGVPSRDLRVSPDHAIAFDGVLIPARALIGDVAQQEQADSVVYYHIMVDGHDLVIAENTPCETLLDADDPVGFDNNDDAPITDVFLAPCLPRVTQGEAVEAARAQMRARALAAV